MSTSKKKAVPDWSAGGIICTGETYKKAVKLTFVKGASLPDPERLFNSSLDGNVRRAIDFAAGAKVDERALRRLIQAAVDQGAGGKQTPSSRHSKLERN